MEKSELECIVAAILAAGVCIAADDNGEDSAVQTFKRVRETLKKEKLISHD